MNFDSFFEYLVPALFFVFYIITKILEARNKRASPRDIPEEAEPSTIDEVRREIQKKILERQKQNVPQRPYPEASWTHEAPIKRQPQAPKVSAVQKATPPREDYMLRLKKEKQRLETSREEAKKIREKLSKKGDLITQPRQAPAQAYSELQATLRNPAQARKAYLYHEIFGTPIALRKREGMLPCWKL